MRSSCMRSRPVSFTLDMRPPGSWAGSSAWPTAASPRPFTNGKGITGLLLRSAVVSGWPLLSVDALSQDSENREVRHERLRFDRLAPDILLCLFERRPTRFEVHLPQEAVHFGVEADDQDPPEFSLPGKSRDALAAAGVMLKNGRLRLTEKLPVTFNPATFAHDMVAGVSKVIFERSITSSQE